MANQKLNAVAELKTQLIISINGIGLDWPLPHYFFFLQPIDLVGVRDRMGYVDTVGSDSPARSLFSGIGIVSWLQ